MTEKLTEFFARLKPSPFRHAWLGDVGEVRQSHRPYEIARRAGLAPGPDAFVSIDQKLAAQVLAFLQTGSLAYGPRAYRESVFRECKGMIAELGDRAQFWSNSSFEGWFSGADFSGWGWNGITQSTFDTGVIGCSQETAFVFWIEEED